MRTHRHCRVRAQGVAAYDAGVTPTFSNETDAHRYVMRDGSTLLAVLDYASNGSAISFTRAFTSPEFRGRGYAADITQYAVDDVEKTTDLRVIPMCWYVGEWFDKHPERADLLTR
jgi:predicted GNAT family acetyltransferase